jgi:hypothetical protein
MSDPSVQQLLSSKLGRGERLQQVEHLDGSRVLFVIQPAANQIALIPRSFLAEVDFEGRAVSRIIDPYEATAPVGAPPPRSAPAPASPLVAQKKVVMDERPLDVAAYMARHLGVRQRVESLLGGSGAAALLEALNDRPRAESLVASVFWQVFLLSPAYARHLARLRASPEAVPRLDPYVVPQRLGTNEDRYDLLLLDPSMPQSETPRAVDVAASPQEMMAGWRRWDAIRSGLHADGPKRRKREPIARVAQEVANDRQSRIIDLVSDTVAVDALGVGHFAILYAPAPPMIMTAVPPEPWMVTGTDGASTGTVGVIAANVREQVGVTTALHVLGPQVSTGMPVDVNGRRGTVVSPHPITDSVFIDVPGLALADASTVGGRGPLRGLPPRLNETLSFAGATSGAQQTTITAFAPDITLLLPNVQLRFLTTADTAAGDSGAAAVDADGHVVGFAFARTGVGAKLAYASWIVAETVYDAHHLADV